MKRLIVCCDGTWQDIANIYPTNVVKTLQAILPYDSSGVEQIAYYDEGLGAKQISDKRSLIDNLIKLGGGAVGLGIDHKIQDAYRFLCLNYAPNDEIFLFGFSRGAYTVRCLAGLIYNSGLCRRRHVRMIPSAYELYRDRALSKRPGGADAVSFRSYYGDRVPIKALCCWDTVASLGLPDIPFVGFDEKFNERYSFYDNRINRTIEHAYHAVSIDENRRVYYYTPMESDRTGQLSQVWFPGGHGCVGGGSKDERGLSDGPLDWILNSVASLGLALDKSTVEYGKLNGETEYGVYPAFDAPFAVPESLLGYRSREFPAGTTLADLDKSVKQRWHDAKCNYRPRNLQQKFGKELDEQPSAL